MRPTHLIPHPKPKASTMAEEHVSKKDFDATILDGFMQMAIFDVDLTTLSPGDTCIAMMTIGVKTNITLSSLGCFDGDFKMRMEHDKRFRVIDISPLGNRFSGSRGLKLVYGGKKKYVRAFKNGNFNITGCKNSDDAHDIIEALFKHAELFIDMSTVLYKAHLMCFNFPLNRMVDMRALHSRILAVFPSTTLDLNSAVKGVHIKIPATDEKKELTAIVHASGKVVMTGAKTMQHIYRIYSSVASFVDKHYNDVSSPLPPAVPKTVRPRGRPRKGTVVDEYSSLLAFES